MEKYIHYGHKQFEKEQFKPVRNSELITKPKGGFWASPVNTGFGWRDWCREEGTGWCDGADDFVFQLKNNANVVHIRDFADLKKIPRQKSDICGLVFLDFERMREEGADAVELHLTCNGNMNNELYFALYGWDCDSILILNPEIVLCDSDCGRSSKMMENNLSK